MAVFTERCNFLKLEYKYAVALTSAIGLFMAVLDNTIVNVALTPMQRAFNTDTNTIQWVITGYFLSQAAVIPAAGYFGNRFGVKPVFMICLGLFTLGSLLCGLSPDISDWTGISGVNLLIIFRVFQGIGGGALFPLSTAIAFNVFPPAERARSSAIIAVPVLIAPALGPTIGGIIVDSGIKWLGTDTSAGWPGIFFINVPIGIIAVFLIGRILKPDTGRPAAAPVAAIAGAADAGTPPPTIRQRASFDFVGLALSMVGIIAVVYGFNLVGQTDSSTVSALNPRGDIYGWGYWQVWTYIIVGLVILAAFAFYETRMVKDPVLDLTLFKSSIFLNATIVTWITRAVVFGSFLLLPIFLEGYRGFSATTTGLTLMPQGIGAIVGIIFGSRLYDIIGPRAQVILGMLFLVGSSLILAVALTSEADWMFFTPILILRGAGFGLSNLPLQTVALSSITGRGLPKASSLYNATGQVFSSIGTALMTTIFTEATKDTVKAAFIQAQPSVKRAVGQLMAANPKATKDQIAQVTTDAVRPFLLNPAVDGIKTAFMVVTIGTAIGILFCFLLPAKSLKQQQIAEGKAPATDEARPAFAAE